MRFKKQLNFFDLFLYGLGLIIGAGIYVLIGPTVGLAGKSAWLSFIFAMLIVIFTGLGYAKLTSMYPKEAAEYFIVKKVFNSNFFSFLIAWLLITAQIVGISVVSIGFASYLHVFVHMPKNILAILIVAFSTAIALLGVKEVSKTNLLLTSIAILGLFIVIAIGLPQIELSLPRGNFSNIFKGSALVFFAFFGFESIVNLAGETKNPSKTVPKALLASIIVSSLIYVLVALSAVAVVPVSMLARSDAPLALVTSKVLGDYGFGFMDFIALFSTASTVLILSVVAPRLVWAIAQDGFLPKGFKKLNRKGVPLYATLLVAAVSIIFVLLFNRISIVAEIANFNMLLVYAIFNVTCIVATKSNKLSAYLGLLTISFLMVFLNKVSFLIGCINLAIAVVVYRLVTQEKS